MQHVFSRGRVKFSSVPPRLGIDSEKGFDLIPHLLPVPPKRRFFLLTIVRPPSLQKKRQDFLNTFFFLMVPRGSSSFLVVRIIFR